MFKKIKNQKLYKKIVKQIGDLIKEGKLRNGDKLPSEIELSKFFATSRATIREAMSALEISGLVESKGSQGNFITKDASNRLANNAMLKYLMKNHSPVEVFETRSEIEPVIGSIAANRRNIEDLKKLKNCLEKLNSLGRNLENCLENKSIKFDKYDKYMEEDRNFHLLIAKSTHNSVLFLLYNNISLMLKEQLWKIMKKKSIIKDGNLRKFEKEHTDIFNAIQNSDSETTRIIMREHLESIENDMFDSDVRD